MSNPLEIHPSEFAQTLTNAFQRSGLSLERISARLRASGTPVSIATLSYWQTGRSLPTRARSRKALEELEQILGLPPGQLVRSLPGNPLSRWDPQSAIKPEAQLMDALDAMGLDLNRHATSLSWQDSYTISEDRLQQLEVVRQLVRSDEDGFSRLGAIFIPDDDDDPPTITAGRGCQLGETVVLDGGRMLLAEILLAKTLQRGDLLMYDYALEWESSSPMSSFERSLASGARFLTLEATFLGDPPTTAEYYSSPSIDASKDQVVHLPVPPGPHIHHSAQNVPAGLHGLGWKDLQTP